MSGPLVTFGCAVVLSPGALGPPDSGLITLIPQSILTVGGLPVAVTGSFCQMINSVSGVPYPLVIGSVGGSSGIKVSYMKALRIGDQIPSGTGVLTIIGPPTVPAVNDGTPP